MRRQQKDYKTGFQNGYPPTRRIYGNAAIAGQRRAIEHLPDPTGAQRQKALKGIHVADIDQRTHIALEIGLHVVGEPFRLIIWRIYD